MLLKEIFPRWHKTSRFGDGIWLKHYNIADDETFSEFSTLIVAEQNATQIPGAKSDSWDAICVSISSDIIALKRQAPPERTLANLHYLQFEACVWPTKRSIYDGDLHRTHDWILNSFSDDVSREVERPFFTSRAYGFVNSGVDWIERECLHSLADWLSSFYYYCWQRAALPDVAENLWHLAYLIATHSPVALSERVQLSCYLLCWAREKNAESAWQIAAWLERQFDDPSSSRDTRLDIAYCFSTMASTFSSKSARSWAAWALENDCGYFTQHEPISLLVATTESAQEWDNNFSTIRHHIFRTNDGIHRSQKSAMAKMLAIERRASVLEPLTYKAHKYDRRTDLVDILADWYQIPEVDRRIADILFLLPHHEDGAAYLGHRPYIARSERVKERASDVTEITNISLNLTLTVSGGDAVPAAPPRAGQPNYELAHEFERALMEYYSFETLLDGPRANGAAMVSFQGLPHPLQALMKKVFDASLPLSSSLQKPLADRKIRKVGIWYGGDDYYSEMEAEALRVIFESAGISADVRSGPGSTGAQFLDFYQAPEFDLLWIAGHGIYDHWNPNTTSIQTSPGINISVDQLLSTGRSMDERRLLVLNICDGGVSMVSRGIHKIGLAPMLANRGQAVISHHWPVEPRVAAAFGMLLAKALNSSTGEFFDSFDMSLKMLRRHWADVLSDFEQLNSGELYQRLSNYEPDMRSIFHWGSPCFFE